MKGHKHDSDVSDSDNFGENSGIIELMCKNAAGSLKVLIYPLFVGHYLGYSLGGYNHDEEQMVQLMLLCAVFGRMRVNSDSWGWWRAPLETVH